MDPHLRRLVERYCEQHRGWVTWWPEVSMTIRKEGLQRHVSMSRAVHDPGKVAGSPATV
jgi:hypothetical protein